MTGVGKAVGVLRDYYQGGGASMIQDGSDFNAFIQQPAMPEKHITAGGAGDSTIIMLAVVEFDFSDNSAKEEAEEADAAACEEGGRKWDRINRLYDEAVIAKFQTNRTGRTSGRHSRL